MSQNIDLSKLLSLNDKELKERILTAAGAAGADTRKVQGVVQDVSKLRQMIGTLTDKDVQNLLQTIGKDKAEEIAKLLNDK